MKIEFLLKAEVSDLYFSMIKEEATFRCVDENITIHIIQEHADKTSKHFPYVAFRCLSELVVGEEIYDFIDNFINDKFLITENSKIKLPFIIKNGHVKDGVVTDREVIDIEGNIRHDFSPTLEMLPDEIQSICKDMKLHLNKVLKRFTSILIWFQGLESSHQPFKMSPSVYWRVKEGSYYLLPFPKQGSFSVGMRKGISWRESDVDDLEKIWSTKDIDEPLAHELWREALAVSKSSPRSGFLILCTALETGVKQHISNVVPDAEWLITSIQSPPIAKILNKYFPILHSDSTIVTDWTKLTKEINAKCVKMIDYRNTLAHSGNFDEAIPLNEYFKLVRNILYIIDALEGHEWAKNRVDLHMKKLLDWTVTEDDKSLGSTVVIKPMW